MRGLFAGDTDYSNQGLADICDDLTQWNNAIHETMKDLKITEQKLKLDHCWDLLVAAHFQDLIAQAMLFLNNAHSELANIIPELTTEIREDHVKRIDRIGLNAAKLNITFGEIWHGEPRWLKYGEPGFDHVQVLYREGRDMMTDLMDLRNVADRLKDFVGMKNNEVLQLNPNVYGFGINLRNFWQNLKRWWQR